MLEEICDSELDAINWGLMEIGVFRRAQGEQAEAMRAHAREQFARIWDRVEGELLGSPWAAGDVFGRADAALYPHLTAANYFGFPLTERHPKLRDWVRRAGERPSVARDAAELIEAMSTGFGSDAHMKSRQYRDHRLEWMFKAGGREIVLRGLDKGNIRLADDY
jgi:glutathione S-transferase